AGAMRQRPFAGGLDHRAIRHGVGEWHAELDDVGAARNQRVHDVDGGVGVWITRGNVRNQGRAPGFAGSGKTFADARHSGSPVASATLAMSLSPRPERQTRICWSGRMVTASLRV